MRKYEFLSILAEGLKDASIEERAAAMQYYNEYIDEAGPEREEEVIAELGSPNKIAGDIIAASGAMATTGFVPPKRSEKPEPIVLPDVAPQYNQTSGGHPYEEMQPSRSWDSNHTGYDEKNMRIARIILVVLVVLLVIPIIGGLLGVVGGLIAALVCIFIVPFVLGLALSAGGIVTIVTSALLTASSVGSGILGIGVGIVIFALGGLCFTGATRLLGKTLPKTIRAVAAAVGGLFKKLAGVVSGVIGGAR